MLSRLMLLFLPIFQQSPNTVSELKPPSRVTSVVVYADRAHITRALSLHVTEGTHSVSIDHLPASLEDRTVRVQGVSEGSARILDVKVEPVYIDTIPHQRVQELTKRLQTLRQERSTITNKLAVLKGQFVFIDSLQAAYTRSISVPISGRGNYDDWERMLTFLERHRSEGYQTDTDLERQLREKDVQIEVIQQELRRYGGSGQKLSKRAIIVIEVTRGGTISADISYQVPGASWTAAYDLRLSPHDSTVRLSYFGSVWQSTGEDWKNVSLQLSTAQPALGGDLPPVDPWIVGTRLPSRSVSIARAPNVSRDYTIVEGGATGRLSGQVTDAETGEPLIGANVLVDGTSLGASTDVNGTFVINGVPNGSHSVRATYVGHTAESVSNVQMREGASTQYNFRLRSSGVQAEAVVITGERPLIQRNTTSTVRVRGSSHDGPSKAAEPAPTPISLPLAQDSRELTSTTFRIDAPADIPADGSAHRVTIAAETLPVRLTYISVPRHSPYVYVQASMPVTTTYPLVAGTANIFTDNTFIASAPIPPTPSKDTVRFSLGVDETIRTERIQTQRYVETVGTFTRKTRVTYTYVFRVRSARQSPVTVELREAMPVSRTEDIEVDIINPPNARSMMDAQGILTWKPTVGPGREEALTVTYAIEFPANRYLPLQ